MCKMSSHAAATAQPVAGSRGARRASTRAQHVTHAPRCGPRGTPAASGTTPCRPGLIPARAAAARRRASRRHRPSARPLAVAATVRQCGAGSRRLFLPPCSSAAVARVRVSLAPRFEPRVRSSRSSGPWPRHSLRRRMAARTLARQPPRVDAFVPIRQARGAHVVSPFGQVHAIALVPTTRRGRCSGGAGRQPGCADDTSPRPAATATAYAS
jgi:hypothetical protein